MGIWGSEDTGGAGAETFTELTDAPGMISPNAVICGDDTGEALKNSYLTYEENNDERILHLHAHATGGGEMGMVSDSDVAKSMSYVDDTIAQLWVQHGIAANLSLSARPDGSVEMALQAGQFKMFGLDVEATDATATMTVDGVEYSIAKAIKVKIGTDTFFWPLFGPVA
jgi:hypothetical protein